MRRVAIARCGSARTAGPRPAAYELLGLIETAALDGVKVKRLKPKRLARALAQAGRGKPEDIAKAEIAVSSGYAAYVKAMRAAPRAAMIYESAALAPAVPTTLAALQAAAAAPSLEAHVGRIGWMHPLYAPVRRALAEPQRLPGERAALAANLARIRALPAMVARRYVLVDAAGAMLWLYENGKPAGSMRVIVGKPGEQTPMIAGFLRYAIHKPYWNVPEDLVRSRIATNVLDKGEQYLRDSGYELFDGWEDSAPRARFAEVDWPAVAAGRRELRVRQLPGPANFMGRVKFMFGNQQGIYLHDTPDKALLREADRHLSSGCVRLENAGTFHRWLFARPLPSRVRGVEQRADLAEPVPVYITYLTAFPEQGGIAFRNDPYGRDGVTSRMAAAAK